MKLCFLVCVDPEMEKTQMFGIRYMPVWAYTLAAHIRTRTSIQLLLHDTRISGFKNIPEADVYFYSALNQDIPINVKLVNSLRTKYPKAKHAIGGPATTSLKMASRLETLAGFDGIFIGEGEEQVLPFIEKLITSTKEAILFEAGERFSLERSLEMDFQLLRETYHHYYGGVIEVSRGCPFLCEFCDIRTLPDNNRAHNRSIEILTKELEQFHQLGINNILFACDNFIGDPFWAERLADAIILHKEKTGHAIKAYTWLTINVSNHPRLIEKMKRAGFDMFFIGIESFGTKQLLETAKVQNTKFNLPDAIKTIQSYGVVVVAGLIFGFDTDTDDTVQEALDGILSSGLISGDPTLLTALSGTPLYRRMQLAGRLREGKVALGGHKYSTNIKYLRSKQSILNDYIYFVGTFNSCGFQLKRYQQFLSCLSVKATTSKGGYIEPKKILKLIFGNSSAFKQMILRLSRFLISPARVMTVFYALMLTYFSKHGSMSHFSFWVFNWSNSLIKYSGISSKDFNIESVEGPITRKLVLPDDYLTDYFEPIPAAKIKAQRQFTVQAMKELVPDE